MCAPGGRGPPPHDATHWARIPATLPDPGGILHGRGRPASPLPAAPRVLHPPAVLRGGRGDILPRRRPRPVGVGPPPLRRLPAPRRPPRRGALLVARPALDPGRLFLGLHRCRPGPRACPVLAEGGPPPSRPLRPRGGPGAAQRRGVRQPNEPPVDHRPRAGRAPAGPSVNPGLT